MGLLHPYHVPDSHFWKKLASSIDHTEVFNDFFKDFKNNDNVNLSHTADPSSPNNSIRDHCMSSSIKLKTSKDHSKEGSFQTMLNQKFCNSLFRGYVCCNGVTDLFILYLSELWEQRSCNLQKLLLADFIQSLPSSLYQH